MIKISVVTITYNAGQTLPRTLESVLRQSYRDVEHLIVDGASTDNTLALTEAYIQRSKECENGHEVSVRSAADRGIYDAMNKGLQRVTGDYVVFLNAGDCFPDNGTLEHVAKYMEGKPAVVYGDTDVVDDQGRFLHHRRLSPPEHLSWLSFRRGMLVCHQAFYVRSDLAKQHLYDLQYRFSADVDWCIRVMQEAERQKLPMVNVHKVVVNYLNEGQTTLNHKASLKERFRVMRNHYGLATTLLMHVWFVVRMVFK